MRARTNNKFVAPGVSDAKQCPPPVRIKNAMCQWRTRGKSLTLHCIALHLYTTLLIQWRSREFLASTYACSSQAIMENCWWKWWNWKQIPICAGIQYINIPNWLLIPIAYIVKYIWRRNHGKTIKTGLFCSNQNSFNLVDEKKQYIFDLLLVVHWHCCRS